MVAKKKIAEGRPTILFRLAGKDLEDVKNVTMRKRKRVCYALVGQQGKEEGVNGEVESDGSEMKGVNVGGCDDGATRGRAVVAGDR